MLVRSRMLAVTCVVHSATMSMVRELRRVRVAGPASGSGLYALSGRPLAVRTLRRCTFERRDVVSLSGSGRARRLSLQVAGSWVRGPGRYLYNGPGVEFHK